jgi:hypothetical protein
VAPITYEQAAAFLQRRQNLYPLKAVNVIELEGGGVACAYVDIDCFRSGWVRSSYRTQGKCLMLPCKYETLTVQAYEELPEDEKYRCTREGELYYHLQGSAHARDRSGNEVQWLFPGNLVQAGGATASWRGGG